MTVKVGDLVRVYRWQTGQAVLGKIGHRAKFGVVGEVRAVWRDGDLYVLVRTLSGVVCTQRVKPAQCKLAKQAMKKRA